MSTYGFVTIVFVMIVVGFLSAGVQAIAAVRRDQLRWDFLRHVYDSAGRRDPKDVLEELNDRDDDDS